MKTKNYFKTQPHKYNIIIYLYIKATWLILRLFPLEKTAILDNNFTVKRKGLFSK